MKGRVFVFLLLVGSAAAQLTHSQSSRSDSDSIDTTSAGTPELEVQLKRPNGWDRNHGVPGSGLVSLSDLGVPGRARKEFEKANELMGKQDLAHAIQKLNKAISIYPPYAVAYNNLGVIYSWLGDPVHEREALQRAITINDHFALAYVKLGRLNIAAGDFPGAETALDKASTLDPTDLMTQCSPTRSSWTGVSTRPSRALARHMRSKSLTPSCIAWRRVHLNSKGSERMRSQNWSCSSKRSRPALARMPPARNSRS